ncbi:MAG: SpoIID/LytB domain-containing protein [Aminivibrio sp.]|jgi:stage II sporulation protein D|nr:SpoIID/LytB domain-containing protein [Synergistaceae bacterium]
MLQPFKLTLRVLTLLMLVLIPFRADARNVSVGLSISRPSVSVSSASAIGARDGAGKSFNLGKSCEIKFSGKNSVSAGGRTLRLPVTLSSKSPLAFNGRRYRGHFRIIDAGGSITLINVLDLEDYLRGVIKMEIDPKWHPEAVKAQAIVSRTYALRSVLQNKGRNGYDLQDSVMSQVYRGINAEDKRSDQAINATRGVVVRHGKDLAFTPFHSDSGGSTADVAAVWGGVMPYLKGVKEPFPSSSPNANWEVRLSASQVESALKQAGADVGTLRELKIGDKDSFGRPTTLIAIGSGGTKTVKSHAFRMAAGSTVIKSTFFSIDSAGAAGRAPVATPLPVAASYPATGAVKDVPTSDTPMTTAEERQLTALTEQGVFNGEELMDMLMNPNKRKGYLIRALRTRRPADTPPPSSTAASASGGIVFRGKGWGHGVGLSQWGTKTLAEQGWDYKKIILHYFPGVTIGKM